MDKLFLLLWMIGIMPSAWLWFRLFYRDREHREDNWSAALIVQSIVWPIMVILFLLLSAPHFIEWIVQKVYGLNIRKVAAVETEKARTELGAKYRQRAEMAVKHRRLEEEITLLEVKAYPLR